MGIYDNQMEQPKNNSELPAKISMWSKFKAFWLQDVNREIVVEMTPKQAKVLQEVRDFWCQDITTSVDLFQKISFK